MNIEYNLLNFYVYIEFDIYNELSLIIFASFLLRFCFHFQFFILQIDGDFGE
jgi:hypothetical protein